MNSVELVKKICKERGIAISRLERDCGFSNGYIRKLKEGKFPSDRLQIIANYLNVSVDYLLNGDEVVKMRQDKEYYEDAQLAQEMFEDADMRSLFHMKKNMGEEKFSAHVRYMKDLYRLEHPEEEDFY